MTLGQQIQTLRKKRGLSQEGLGESLGVSRQAVSQWESDSSVPEVEKLVMLSRFFEVSVGSLLQVEEHTQAAPETGADALDTLSFCKPEDDGAAARITRKRWAHIAAGLAVIVLVGVIGTLWSRTGSLERQVEYLSAHIVELETLSAHIAELETKINEAGGEAPALDPNAPLVAAFDFTGYRPTGGSYVSFTLSLTAAQSVEGMKVTFLVSRSGGGTVSQEAVTGTGVDYTASMTIPHWTGSATISAVFELDGQRYTQGLVEVLEVSDSGIAYNNLWHKDG